MENWSSHDTIYPHLPLIVCWFVWISRNKTIFENFPISIKSTCFLILGELNPVRLKKLSAPRSIQPLSSMDGNIAWFDGASQISGSLCGAGGKILRCAGSWIIWTLNCGSGTNTKAELLGAWGSLFLASRLNITNLHLKGDSKTIIDWLNGKGILRAAALECWKDRIHKLLLTLPHTSFTHLYREQNQEADSLSKKALWDSLGILYYQIWEGGLENNNHSISIF
jgi:ribonuclease HI